MAPALFMVLKANREEIYPEHFLKAGGETLAMLFLVCGIITAIFNPDSFSDNPLMDRLGYNNLCVVFDTAPATYVAQGFYVACAYLCIRYTWTDYERTMLIASKEDARELSGCQVNFSVTMDVLFTLSICVFGLVFVINPQDSVFWHSCAFLQFVFCRFFVVVANFLEHPEPEKKSWIFLYYYGFTSFAFPISVLICFATYDETKKMQPVIPWYITCSFDYMWLIGLAATSKMLPNAEILKLKTELGEYENLLPGKQDDGVGMTGSDLTVAESPVSVENPMAEEEGDVEDQS